MNDAFLSSTPIIYLDALVTNKDYKKAKFRKVNVNVDENIILETKQGIKPDFHKYTDFEEVFTQFNGHLIVFP